MESTHFLTVIITQVFNNEIMWNNNLYLDASNHDVINCK